MKKITALLSAIMLCSSAYSATQINNQYASTMHPIQTDASMNLLHPPTNISVVNASSDYIYAVVPNSPVNDYVRPGFNDHIYNYDPGVFSTYLVLQDVYRNTFYAQTVCREAIVVVTGYYRNYRINTDSDLCN